MPALVQARSGLSHSPFGGNALRALPPTFTRKSALRSRAHFFLMPALVQARSGLCPHPVRSVGMPCGHCPLLSLAKAPCAPAPAFFLCPRSCKHGAGYAPLSVRWECPAGIASYFHSQKRLALPRSPFSYARARASTERAMPSLRPFGGNALRALTPTFTRKSALRSRARFFLMPALVQARSGHKKNARTPNGAGRFCSLVPVVGLEPTRILLHRILSPARLPVSPHRRTK